MARRKTNRKSMMRAEAAARGYTVHMWSPGDGITRYRFFERAPKGQTYFGPDNPTCTALGQKAAYKFLHTGTCPRGRG